MVDKINITDIQANETNVDWYADGERANSLVLNRPIKQIAGIVNEIIDDTNNRFQYISDVDGNVQLGQLISVEDYAAGHDSGILFFKVVAAGTGTADGGKYIDLPTSGLQLQQNLKRPYSCKAWGAKSNATNASDNDVPLQNWLDYRGKLHAPSGNYNHTKPLFIHSGTIIFGDGVVLDASVGLPDGTTAQTSDLVTTFTKEGNDATGGADANFIFGNGASSKYITVADLQLDSTSNTEFGFWRGMEGANLEVSSLTYSNIVVRNHQKGSWLEKAYLIYYHRFVMGGGSIGLYCGYNNSTSNHAYDCYMNLVDTGYWFNSVYSSINNSASDKANIGYRLGNSVELNNCGCEFPNIGIFAEYTADPVVVNKLKLIAKDTGTTIVYNYDAARCASVIIKDSSLSATTTAKANLTIANVKGVAGKPRTVQFINTYVDTYNAGTDSTDRFPLWDFGLVRNPTDRFVTIMYGPNQRQKFFTEALSHANVPNKKLVLIRLSVDYDYEVVFNKPSGYPTNTVTPEGRLATAKFIVNGDTVALESFSKFHADQVIKFFSKTGDDNAIYLQYEQEENVGNDVTVTITGGLAENVYNLQQVETPSNFTELTPLTPL